MFVKCKIKTILEKPIEFVLNRESIVSLEKIVNENSLNLHTTTGTYDFRFDNEDIKNEAYDAFVEFFATGETVISDNLSLLTL